MAQIDDKEREIQLQRIEGAKDDYTHDDIVDLTSRLMLISGNQPIRTGTEQQDTDAAARKAQGDSEQQKRIQLFLTLFNRIDSFTDAYLELLRNEILMFEGLECTVSCCGLRTEKQMVTAGDVTSDDEKRPLLELAFSAIGKRLAVHAPAEIWTRQATTCGSCTFSLSMCSPNGSRISQACRSTSTN